MSMVNQWQHLKIPFDKIEAATESFKTLIGRGGYGLVYKGKLLVSGKETIVAVKRLNDQSGQGLKEFLTEIQLLSGQQHPNLVSLVGFCDEGREKSIVYEYAERGSLDQYISRTRKSNFTTLTWLQRLKICVDAARGLDHLHNHLGGHKIIHRDIKSSNILIDENWVGKISDLGLSKLGMTGFGTSFIVTNCCGTHGYCEPEYYTTGIVTRKSDVYSFGVVLFEVLCGRLCLIDGDDGFRLSSISAKYHYKKKSLDKIMDDSLREHMGSYSMTKFLEIAYRCLHDNREQRPAMDDVVKELEEALKFQVEIMSERVKGTTIGIDLGMKYSCVDIWKKDFNVVEIIPNEQGNRITPSCVAFNDSKLFVGKGAKNQIARNPTNTAFDVKHLIGSRFNDHQVQNDMKWWPFNVMKGDSEKPSIVVEYKGEIMSERVKGTTIGIDLGMKYSCVAIWKKNFNRVEIIPNEQGNRITPSCVAFNDTKLFVGESAKNQIARNPTNTVFDVKRLIGSRFSDPQVQKDMKLWPFKVMKGAFEKPSIVVEYKGGQKKFTPEELSSIVLKKMKEIAEGFLGKEVNNVVITVPAYFNNQQREATKKAGIVAGLNVVCLLNEPTAAAIAYGLDKVRDQENWNKDNKTILVFDLGDETFDLSLLTINKTGVIDVKAVGGDTHLGGNDFDATLINYCIKTFERRHECLIDTRALGILKVYCKKAKRGLSSMGQVCIKIDSLYAGLDFFIRITRAEFEELNSMYYEKCIELLEKCLRDGDMAKTDVDEVVVVGRSSWIPKVQRMLEEFFDGKKLHNRLDGTEVVVTGAAILAARLSGDILSD